MIISHYQQELAIVNSQIKHYTELVNRYSLFRLGTIIGGLTILFVSFKFDSPWLSAGIAILIVLLFIWLIATQNKYDQQKEYHINLKKVLENELNVMSKQASIYNNGHTFEDDHHSYTSDLDIFGPKSLFQLINRCATVQGIEELSAWLKHPADINAINSRQEAVKEICQKHKWRTHFQTLLLFNLSLKENPVEGLLRYLKLPRENHKLLRRYVMVAPWLFIGLLCASFLIPKLFAFVIALGISHIGIIINNQLYINKTDVLVGKIGKTLSDFSAAFKAIENENWQSSLCIHLTDSMKSNTESTISETINLLSSLIIKLDYRLNVYVAVILNAIFLWDLRQVFAIENWKELNKANIDEAFHCLAKFEVLNSMACLSANNSSWIFPEIIESENCTYEAKELGHPLIAQNLRITNNYELINDRKIDIITGSNMAGKSTFLRTLGINAVLGLSGASVCASQMRLSPIQLVTYMRIRDSLNESTSTFKAELNRLQLVLETVPKTSNTFFLIDEMLRGTNSVDKYRGSKAVVEKLIAGKGVGVVATHDLQVAHLIEKYPDYIRNFYFDIQVKDNEMHFDYKLKQGECKTFNASLLLKQIGIEVD
ncbi:MutS-related protein [Solitalea lacus]|uniref:MutS-related protein n=1 Tax=Solitalea lacus TaxID=2911172 RepID=UPI001EDA38C1|nr:DNA mismatch repair protein MutS [Solitalea lacus]UKJ08096.1 DNA mismatch repair protein MutS [Solitalea lacus]